LDTISVIYADDVMVVLDKPSGLLSVPGRGEDKQDCLSARVQQHYPDACIVHRLDMATSGLMVMARGVFAQRCLNDAFAARTVHKRYEAVVEGLPTPQTTDHASDWSVINLPIFLDWPNRPKRVIDPVDGKPSVTRWRILTRNNAAQTSHLELEPITGRSHQLRVHLQAIHHPILGDALYAPPSVVDKAERLLLHATVLELPHPVNQKTMRFVSQAPF
jgi:tRNA pseudouridine32 synthase/23S rRNA pseudouridine746 synthase